MNILLVTDAWVPQVNGVVRSLSTTRTELEAMGHRVTVLSPQHRTTVPCPSYPEIRLTLRPGKAVREVMCNRQFDAVHIATEGPLGWAARRWCRRHWIRFTSSYHTRFPEYVRMRAPIPLKLSYALVRRFHSAAEKTMVRTETQRTLLSERGFRNLEIWPGAVDTAIFQPRGKDALELPRPIAMYMGRVAPEKNIEAFLQLDLPGSKVVIGGGPSLERYRGNWPGVHFLGYRHGEELARTLAAADVFVFPSRTDTLGLVMLEAMACGVPVAGFPVPGPADLVIEGRNGALDEDLKAAVFRALAVPGEGCVEYAAEFSWRRSAERFLQLLMPAIPTDRDPPREPYNPDECQSRHPDPKHASISPMS